MFKSVDKEKIGLPLPAGLPTTINCVRFDARVLSSMIQNDSMCIQMDEGYLFGVAVGDVLEITNCISLPPEKTSTEYESEAQKEAAHRQFLDDRQKYQSTFADCFRRMNMDSEVVGWYNVAFPEGPASKSVVEVQYQSQADSPTFIMVSYDPFRSLSGKLQLRVMRLTKEYMTLRAKGELTQRGVTDAGLVSAGIYEEIPYDVHVPLLTRVFLYETDVARREGARDGNAVMAEREHSAYLKRCLGNIASSLDSLSRDLGECTGKPMRRKGRDTNEAAARHSSLLTSRGLVPDLQHTAEMSAEFTQSALIGAALSSTNQ
eukprot:PhM_4_TR16393/c0_g1_i1/m.88306/K03247/EIF3H; translation initiation factor 3 subunit H